MIINRVKTLVFCENLRRRSRNGFPFLLNMLHKGSNLGLLLYGDVSVMVSF